MAEYGDLNYSTSEINIDLAKIHDKSSLVSGDEIADMLTKTEASTTYQPIGDYATKEEITDLLTEEEVLALCEKKRYVLYITSSENSYTVQPNAFNDLKNAVAEGRLIFINIDSTEQQVVRVVDGGTVLNLFVSFAVNGSYVAKTYNVILHNNDTVQVTNVNIRFNDYALKSELPDISNLATKEELNGKVDDSDISDMLTKTEATSTYALKTEIPTKTSNLQNDSDFINKKYVASRGENLVTNGTALLGNNYNFSMLEFDGSDSYFCGGSFKKKGASINMYTDEFIPVSVNTTYQLDYYVKTSETTTCYDYIYMFDIDQLPILAENVTWWDGTTTTLARDLNDGDEVVYLESISNWYVPASDELTYNYLRGFIFWNYKNSYGYQYPIESYSRNTYADLYENSGIDKSSNTIRLKTPWNKGKIPAGTSVSQSNSGGTFSYLNGNYPVEGNADWLHKTGRISGVGRQNEDLKFRYGTAFIKIGWLGNYTGVTNPEAEFKISNISFTNNAMIDDSTKIVKFVTYTDYVSQ